jgi:hypothetical protein
MLDSREGLKPSIAGPTITLILRPEMGELMKKGIQPDALSLGYLLYISRQITQRLLCFWSMNTEYAP